MFEWLRTIIGIFKLLRFHPKSIYNTTSSFKDGFGALEVHAMSSNLSR
jgi:hypothetical protein